MSSASSAICLIEESSQPDNSVCSEVLSSPSTNSSTSSTIIDLVKTPPRVPLASSAPARGATEIDLTTDSSPSSSSTTTRARTMKRRRGPSSSSSASKIPDTANVINLLDGNSTGNTTSSSSSTPLSGSVTMDNSDIIQQLQSKLKCSICLDHFTSMSSTKCGHVFCRQCILQAIKSARKCPLCKAKLKASDVHRLYI